MLEKVAIKNGQSIETDNCIATFIYIISFTVTIFMYQAQLINTEILNKGNNKITELRTISQRESQNSQPYKQTKSVNNRKTVKT